MTDTKQSAEKVSLIGGPYDRTSFVADLPDVILVGPCRVRYAAITDPETGARLGGFAWVSDLLTPPE